MAAVVRHGRWRTLALAYTAAQGMAKLYSHLPIVAIGWLFGSSAAGLYARADRFTCVPSELVATAVGDVYRQRDRRVPSVLAGLTGLMRRTFAAITVIAVLSPFVLAFLLAPAFRT